MYVLRGVYVLISVGALLATYRWWVQLGHVHTLQILYNHLSVFTCKFAEGFTHFIYSGYGWGMPLIVVSFQNHDLPCSEYPIYLLCSVCFYNVWKWPLNRISDFVHNMWIIWQWSSNYLCFTFSDEDVTETHPKDAHDSDYDPKKEAKKEVSTALYSIREVSLSLF